MKYLREINGYGMVEVDKKTADALDGWEISRRLLHQAVDQYVDGIQKKMIREVLSNTKLYSNGWHVENKESFDNFRRKLNGG